MILCMFWSTLGFVFCFQCVGRSAEALQDKSNASTQKKDTVYFITMIQVAIQLTMFIVHSSSETDKAGIWG